jgi:hypothetical protein
MAATLQTYLTQVQRLIHDANFSAFSQQELTDYINEARDDTALDMHCVRHLAPGVQLIEGQEIYPLNGAVAGVGVLSGGAGYDLTTGLVVSAAPAGGVNATAIPIITNGAITSVQMTQWGQGYTTSPNVTTTGDGSGAVFSVTMFNNAFQVLSISNIWNNQRYMLQFQGFTLFQAYFRAWTTQFNARPGIWTIHPQDQLVYLRPAPDQLYISEWDILSTPSPLVNLTDSDIQVLPPWNKAVQFRAAAIALMKHQDFQQAEYYDRKYDQRVPRYIMGAGGIRIPNPYNRSFQRKVAR